MAISKYFIIINPTELAVLKHKSQAYSDKSLIWIGAGPDVAG